MIPLLTILVTSLLVACADEPTTRSSEGEGERKIAYWVAPMDPSFTSNEPGKSPMGMDLIPVYEDDRRGAGAEGIHIDPAVVQNMGVRTARVAREALFRHVRSLGEVEVGENRLSVVNLRFSGWVEKLLVDRTGDPVAAGDTLFEIYSPALVAAQEEFLLAIRTQGAKSDLARSARRKLELWKIATADIEAIERGRKVKRTLPIRAPRSGFVLEKHVVEGARIQEGEDLYHIGDLSTVWVTAEVYEHDAPWLEVGQPAQMELTYEPGRVIDGRVAYVYPTLNKVSRTLSVRLEFENPDYRLKPGMFATVYIQFQRRDDVLVVPTEAIIHSGLRQLVILATGGGHFAPREITTGLVGDRRGTEVLTGLREGELVVVSGQFLIDSESQLEPALRAMAERVSETESEGVAPAAPAQAPTAEAPATAGWTCPMHPHISEHGPGRCPICGMDLVAPEQSGGGQ